MDGIVKGVSRGSVKPVIDGIVLGCPRMKNESVVPDTVSVAPAATKLGADTFGSGLTPQGSGNMGKGKKAMKSEKKYGS